MPVEKDDHFQNGDSEEAVARRPYNAPSKRSSREAPSGEDWNTFIQWMRGTMEYPDGGGFAGDVGRRLKGLEDHNKTLQEALVDLPAAIAKQTSESIANAFIANARTVADAKIMEDAKTEAARKLLASTRRSITTGRIITAILSILVIVVAAIIVNFATHTQAISVPTVSTPTPSFLK